MYEINKGFFENYCVCSWPMCAINRISQGTNKADVDGDALDDIVNSHLQKPVRAESRCTAHGTAVSKASPDGKGHVWNLRGSCQGTAHAERSVPQPQALRVFIICFQQHAAGLLATGSPIIPPGHPLYGGKNSFETLQTENDKLQKENARLKKMLKKEPPAGGPSIPF